ncbi:hypothetical protein I7I53_04485 [Histoplasma capsulatum var. duboisii H88]|uniref:Uncharacterized protein n=1 Tax=Ajellomyces capsulatus (strain H88) TaxID=544711 RepID=A0A8A1LWI5_AJEC8|nr:hypothetical protein I7I53_04485 [Histoplasma capsulatum var. duboisii H88]
MNDIYQWYISMISVMISSNDISMISTMMISIDDINIMNNMTLHFRSVLPSCMFHEAPAIECCS